MRDICVFSAMQAGNDMMAEEEKETGKESKACFRYSFDSSTTQDQSKFG